MSRTANLSRLLSVLMLWITAVAGVSAQNSTMTEFMRIYRQDGSILDLDINSVDSITYPLLARSAQVTATVSAGDSLQGEMRWRDFSSVIGLTVKGKMEERDFRFVRNSLRHLENLDLRGTNAKLLPDGAFRKMLLLKRVSFPATTRFDSDSIFAGCLSLQEIVLSAYQPPKFSEEAFQGIDTRNVRLIVPAGYGLKYACSPWNRLFRIFEEGSDKECFAEPLSDDISVFGIGNHSDARIDTEHGMILINVPYGEDLSALTETFLLKPGISAYLDGELLISGITSHDYRFPHRLLLRDKDGSEKEFIIAVCFGNAPMIYINTADSAPVADKENYVGIDGLLVANSEYANVYSNARMKGRGNSSWGFDKKSYTLKLDKKEKFLGLKKHKTFALIANHTDKTLMRNAFAYQLGKEVFDNLSWSPSTVFAHLVLNGEYLGLYSVTESVKIDANRVNIPNLEDCQSEQEAAQYGFIVEVDCHEKENFHFRTTRNVPISLKEPDGEDISQELRDYVQIKIQTVENNLYSNYSRNPESEKYYPLWFDVDSVIDWYLVNEIAKNKDACFTASCFMYYDPADGRMHFGPLWDFDIGFGNVNVNDIGSPEGFYVKSAPWVKRFFRDPAFVSAVKDRYRQKRELLQDYVENRLVSQIEDLRTDADINFRRWPIFGKYIFWSPEGYQQRLDYQSEVDFLLDWLRNRLEWLDTAIEEL